MKVLIIDDESAILETLEMFLNEKGYEVHTKETGREGLEGLRSDPPDVVILDIRLPDIDGLEVLRRIREEQPDLSVIMITAYHDMETTVQAMKLGAYEYIHKPIDVDELEIAIEKVANNIRLHHRLEGLITDISREYKVHNIVGESREVKEIFKLIGLVSESRTTVLIQGESGTGKELIAHAIHYNSPFRKEPFIPVNCSTLVETLLESELFGHEKGAFTGAVSRKAGKIELAGKGTIFLDEIAELSTSLQVKLLRFLQEREYERVGGVERLRSEARVIAATNRDLSSLVKDRAFRDDLFFRLKVVEIRVPPLRDRTSDIPLLVDHLLNKINAELHRKVTGVPAEVMQMFMDYDWPGNVRELENVLTRAVVLSHGEILLPETLPNLGKKPEKGPEADHQIAPSLQEMEKEHIEHVLRLTNWNRGEACRLLRISRPTLRAKIRKYGLHR